MNCAQYRLRVDGLRPAAVRVAHACYNGMQCPELPLTFDFNCKLDRDKMKNQSCRFIKNVLPHPWNTPMVSYNLFRIFCCAAK